MKKIFVIVVLIFVTAFSFAETHYVNVNNPSPSSPYTSWEDAATSIQDAVDEAVNGDIVLVTNGIYSTGGKITQGYSCENRVVITANILLKSVNGRDVTIIAGAPDSGTGGNGDNAFRCVYLTGSAVLTGFTLSNGYTGTTGN